MLAALGESVAFGAPEFGVGGAFAGHGGFDEQDVGVREVGDMDVVPASFARADDGDVLAREDQFGELVDLAAASVDWATAISLKMIVSGVLFGWRLGSEIGLTVDSRRANDVRLNHISMLGTGFEDDFVDVAVEG